MRSVVVHGPGDLRVDERPDPTPAAGQVLVRIEWGGICGSDLAYLAHGASGTAQLRHPMVLGHEVAGTVIAVGPDVDPDRVGVRAAISPPTLVDPHTLPQRLADRPNLHTSVRYLGSAALDPHTDGGFADRIVVREDQLLPLPDAVDTRRGALAEPLGVALHAIRRAEAVHHAPLRESTVLVNGSGPIGLLVVALAKHLGAARIVAADVSPAALQLARDLGADDTVDVTSDPLPEEVELVFEASGAAGALGSVLNATARGGTLVQVGNLSASPVTAVLGALVSREITWVGSFRFVDEMSEAIALLADGLYVEPIMTHEIDIADAREGFRVAADPASGSSKVMLRLDAPAAADRDTAARSAS